MKRDLNLVRNILLCAIEQECEFFGNPEIEDYSSDQISYHINLMDQAGLVLARNYRKHIPHLTNRYTLPT
ncbi:DUF2513 domain-containing protein [Nitrosomonas supralitoralis]|uniref:DUF2513 domain-containing protein n=1 Tax=Nitrosomonas supralitoralis TaxID=2116706 RepID=UPI001559AC1D|nr:DUF2513 domain-containing protein [Nitrosomonas supralitoralis]